MSLGIGVAGNGPVSVVDIGSNSVRLVIYERQSRSPTMLFNEKVLAGLGRGVASTYAVGWRRVRVRGDGASAIGGHGRGMNAALEGPRSNSSRRVVDALPQVCTRCGGS